ARRTPGTPKPSVRSASRIERCRCSSFWNRRPRITRPSCGIDLGLWRLRRLAALVLGGRQHLERALRRAAEHVEALLLLERRRGAKAHAHEGEERERRVHRREEREKGAGTEKLHERAGQQRTERGADAVDQQQPARRRDE